MSEKLGDEFNPEPNSFTGMLKSLGKSVEIELAKAIKNDELNKEKTNKNMSTDNNEVAVTTNQVNERIYNILKPHLNDYKCPFDDTADANSALFEIYETFIKKHLDKECVMNDGMTIKSVNIKNKPISRGFSLVTDAYEQNGVTVIFEFEGIEFAFNFFAYIEMGENFYKVNISSLDPVKHTAKFMYRYLMYCALEESKLKGSYFTMPQNSFSWDVKEIEKRGFNDIFLPKNTTEDLKLYTNIYDKTGKILRYLMVGNPGTAKTESGLVLANELNKKGVTIIKTPIGKYLSRKVELANVLSPALIIFDDIDLSLGSRNSGGYSQLLGMFLDVLDGTDKLSSDVGIIATTNAAHLLDLAAQRPGRFDKTLLFDDITKGNIKNIIKKSLQYNFEVNSSDAPSVKLYTDSRIVDRFYDAGVSGSHIFNAIKMLKLRYDTLGMGDNVKVEDVLSAISNEITVIDKVKNASYLKDKYDRNTSSIGFGNSRDESPVEEEDEIEFDFFEEVEVTEADVEFFDEDEMNTDEPSIEKGYWSEDVINESSEDDGL